MLAALPIFKKGALKIAPVKLSFGLFIKNDRQVSPPILCPYKNAGNSDLS